MCILGTAGQIVLNRSSHPVGSRVGEFVWWSARRRTDSFPRPYTGRFRVLGRDTFLYALHRLRDRRGAAVPARLYAACTRRAGQKRLRWSKTRRRCKPPSVWRVWTLRPLQPGGGERGPGAAAGRAQAGPPRCRPLRRGPGSAAGRCPRPGTDGRPAAVSSGSRRTTPPSSPRAAVARPRRRGGKRRAGGGTGPPAPAWPCPGRAARPRRRRRRRRPLQSCRVRSRAARLGCLPAPAAAAPRRCHAETRGLRILPGGTGGPGQG